MNGYYSQLFRGVWGTLTPSQYLSVLTGVGKNTAENSFSSSLGLEFPGQREWAVVRM